jgi:hypothetical protein
MNAGEKERDCARDRGEGGEGEVERGSTRTDTLQLTM